MVTRERLNEMGDHGVDALILGIHNQVVQSHYDGAIAVGSGDPQAILQQHRLTLEALRDWVAVTEWMIERIEGMLEAAE